MRLRSTTNTVAPVCWRPIRRPAAQFLADRRPSSVVNPNPRVERCDNSISDSDTENTVVRFIVVGFSLVGCVFASNSSVLHCCASGFIALLIVAADAHMDPDKMARAMARWWQEVNTHTLDTRLINVNQTLLHKRFGAARFPHCCGASLWFMSVVLSSARSERFIITKLRVAVPSVRHRAAPPVPDRLAACVHHDAPCNDANALHHIATNRQLIE